MCVVDLRREEQYLAVLYLQADKQVTIEKLRSFHSFKKTGSIEYPLRS